MLLGLPRKAKKQEIQRVHNQSVINKPIISITHIILCFSTHCTACILEHKLLIQFD